MARLQDLLQVGGKMIVEGAPLVPGVVRRLGEGRLALAGGEGTPDGDVDNDFRVTHRERPGLPHPRVP